MGPVKFLRVVSCSSEDPVSMIYDNFCELPCSVKLITNNYSVYRIFYLTRINRLKIWSKKAPTENGGAKTTGNLKPGLNCSLKIAATYNL